MKQVMYIAINEDLEELMKESGKIEVHTAHAVFDYLYNEYMAELIETDEIWFFYHKIKQFKDFGDTIVVVKASEKDMLKWEKQGYTSVRDKGLTCVEPNSLTAINLGIYDKDEEIPKWIQRLSLLNPKSLG